MSSNPTPPPPGDNSLVSWEKYEVKAAERDKEADREVIDKMLDFQKQFVPPSKAATPPPPARVSPVIGGGSLTSPPNIAPVAEPSSTVPVPSSSENPVGVGLDPTGGSSLDPPPVSSGDLDVVSPSLPVTKKPSTLRKMSSKPDVTEADRKRINDELKSVSRVQLLAAAEEVGNPSEDWWKEHSPCQRCGPSGDCIPHRFKKFPLTSCKLCHGKRLPCSIKINWQITEIARRHPEWPRWWIIDREREGWLKKTRGAKVDPGTGSSSKVSSKSKGKRKAQSEEEEEEDLSSSQDADGDSDSEVVVVARPTKRPRLVTTAASHEYRPYSKPPGPSPLPGRPMAKPIPSKTSQVREVFVLVPPLISPQVSNAAPSKAEVPLFAPSETPEVMVISPSPLVPPPPPVPAFSLDPKSPLNIRIPPRPPRLPSPPASSSLQGPIPVSPDLETRNQVFEGTQFSSGDVLRGRLADARLQSIVFGRGLEQFTTHASAWSLQLESFRREFQDRGFEPSPMNARFFDHVVEESRRLSLYWGDVLNTGDCEHLRTATSGISLPTQQDLIDEMDKEGMDVRWEQ
ncbi:hypothetical protein H0H93_006535 [Arthromyces matolae]|nr:hypothetical protein H0H93_006535 [Arthromyces matolae]